MKKIIWLILCCCSVSVFAQDRFVERNDSLFVNGRLVGVVRDEKVSVQWIEDQLERAARIEAQREEVRHRVKNHTYEVLALFDALTQTYPSYAAEIENVKKAHTQMIRSAYRIGARPSYVTQPVVHAEDDFLKDMLGLYEAFLVLEQKSPAAADKAQRIMNHLYIYAGGGVGSLKEVKKDFLTKINRPDMVSLAYNSFGISPEIWNLLLHKDIYYLRDVDRWYDSFVLPSIYTWGAYETIYRNNL